MIFFASFFTKRRDLRPKTTENLHPKSDKSSCIVTQTETSNVTQIRTGLLDRGLLDKIAELLLNKTDQPKRLIPRIP
jgi:hypothetical protein